jgi:phasin family protein
MQPITNPVIDSYQQQIDASRHIAEVVFEGADRMEHLILDTTRKAFDERMKFYQALAAVRDPQGVAALQSTFFSHTPEQMAKVQQELMKIVTDAQAQITQAMNQYKVGLNGNGASMPAALTSDASSHPNGALNSMLSMWDKAFKDTVAMATGSIASVLSPAEKKSTSTDVVSKPITRKNARTK